MKLILSLALMVSAAMAQTNSLTQTTLAVAALASDRTITVTSATGINAPSSGVIGSQLYVVSPGNPRGESMLVQAVNGTLINVARGRSGNAGALPAGALVLIGQPNYFRSFDPSGACVAANTFITPHVNTLTGIQSLCSTVTLTWVAGWNNDVSPAAPTAAVASAAGAITPSGPLFHVTLANAITGFNIPVGFAFGSFTVIPDGAFTTTTAGNIALASTAVVGKPLTFTFDPATAKFYPSY